MSAIHFPADGSHLERYATVFNAVEINSCFRRRHRASTYERWARSVPEGFRFSLKVPKSITHVRRLAACEELLGEFLDEIAPLGARTGPLVVQLPPSLALDVPVAEAFFDGFRARWHGGLVCEPRHPSWFGGEWQKLLETYGVGRVAADPVIAPGAGEPGGFPGSVYYRLHGSPRTYYSAYGPERVAEYAERLRVAAMTGADTWCIFDNTTLGAAAADALEARRLLA
ncbi:MAG: DUF72 domain-containing protein [Gemmatimonadota bacterium]